MIQEKKYTKDQRINNKMSDAVSQHKNAFVRGLTVFEYLG